MKTYFSGLRYYQVGLALFLLFCVLDRVRCQTPEFQNSDNFRLITLKYSNSSGEKGITHFEYNAFGQLAFSMWKNFNEERSSVNRYTLNEKREIIEKNRLFSDSISSTQTFEYNLCGKILKESFFRSDGVTGEVIYNYDEHGKLRSAHCQKMNGWFTGIIQYVYNSYDVLDEALIQRDKQTIGTISYQYDINGNLLLEKWDFNSLWEQIFIYEYIEVPDTVFLYSNPFLVNLGFYRIEEEFYTYEGGGEGPSEYLYSGEKLVEKTFHRSDGLNTVTRYQYDDSGILLSSNCVYSDGKTAEFFYTFNDNRQMTRRWFKRSDGLEGEEVYSYDAEGRLVMARYNKMDAWLTGTMAISHGMDGLPEKGYFKGDENFDADVYFLYDEYRNIVKIEWVFSFGKKQIYTFKYTPVYKEREDRDDPPQ
jgi:hypothetical protein